MCPRERFQRLSFEKPVFCFHSRILSKIIVKILARCFRLFFQNWLLCVQKNKLRKNFFMENAEFTHPFRTLSDDLIKLLAKRDFGEPVKSAFHASRETFWKKKQFFENFYIRNLFQNLSKKHLAGWSICLYVSSATWNSDRKLYFLGKIKLFLSFPHNMWKFLANSNENGRVVKLVFTLSNETFWGQSSLNEKFFRFPPSLDFEQKPLGRVVTSASQASRGKIWRGTEFWNDLHFFQFGWMTSRRVQNFNLRVQTNVFSDFFWKINLLFSCSDFEQTFVVRILASCFRQISQNWILCVQKNKLRKKHFYGKFRFYSSFSDFERWLNVTFGRNGFGKPVKSAFYSSRETFRRKQFFENFYKSDLFLNVGKNLLAGWSNSLHVSGGPCCKVVPFEKKQSFLSFLHNMWNFIATSNEIGRVVKLAFLIPSGTFRVNVACMKKFLVFFNHSPKMMIT